MHADGGGCEGVVGGEDESTPVLAVVIGCIWGAGEDVMPSRGISEHIFRGRWGRIYSRMFDSEGWATMNGGGLAEIVLYSRVNCFPVSIICHYSQICTFIPGCWLLDLPSPFVAQG